MKPKSGDRIKVIFFDIDGVLNCHNTKSMIDETCLNRLKHIIKETNAFTVMSSSWRDEIIHPEIRSPHSKWLINLVEDEEIKFIGCIPEIDELNREVEVKAWLDETDFIIESFVIIDDIDFGFWEEFPCNFIKIAGHWGNGLDESHMNRAIQILNRK